MNLVWALLITVAVAAVAIAAMLLVRRGAPEGSYFTDGDRASGVFGVLATGFSVLLGFIVFLSFTSYDDARSGAESEALMVMQQVETAQFFPPLVRDKLTGQLICYGRSVVGDEWPRTRAGTLGDSANPWGVAMFGTLQGVEPKAASEQSAYDQWLGQTSQREEARLDRIHPASGVIPITLWIALFFIGGVIFLYMLFFAASGEGAVASVITVMFLLLATPDRPFHSGVGGLEPAAMERTLARVDQALAAVGLDVRIPCDAAGAKLSG